MERFRETSQVSKAKLKWMGLSIFALVVWIDIEVKAYLNGMPSFLGMAYISLFCGLLCWRYTVRYTYILTDDELTIISRFLHFSRTFTVPLNLVESYSNKYVGRTFNRTGMSHFVHRYSSGDGRVTRSLVFKKERKSCAVLFKVSDRFMKELKSVIPKIQDGNKDN